MSGAASQFTSVREIQRVDTALSNKAEMLPARAQVSTLGQLLVGLLKRGGPLWWSLSLESGLVKIVEGQGSKSTDASTSGPTTSLKPSNTCRRKGQGNG